jgi:hypothetical protein
LVLLGWYQVYELVVQFHKAELDTKNYRAKLAMLDPMMHVSFNLAHTGGADSEVWIQLWLTPNQSEMALQAGEDIALALAPAPPAAHGIDGKRPLTPRSFRGAADMVSPY